MTREKFRDPAVKNIHKKKMYDLHMGTKTTQEYFQELEKEAKMARLQLDIIKGGHMICALEQGVPTSYMKFISDLGILIPIQDSIAGVSRKPWGNKKSNTTGTSKRSSSTTTSTGDKKMGTGTTYGSRGQAMDIDALKAEGKCYRCKQKRHISKNCPL
ncbi:uncharacterized protein ARMOST_04646 [Armillaria ostoyae]|uniref:CCHC-type domain-containing protein n=1 Tax=Armillaria ostoyae TaxID=47428 RepID=A0A284QXW8_ARMOS|nr:uncharacterized protein ARMOST_04646 [Armillaria ostoyae]